MILKRPLNPLGTEAVVGEDTTGMNNTIKRVILFVVAFPILGALIYLLPHYHHITINMITVVASILATREMVIMFNKAGFKMSTPFYPLFGGVFPLIQYMIISGLMKESAMTFFLVLLVSTNLIYPVFRRDKEKMNRAVSTIPVAILLLIYPGVFLSYIVRFSLFPQASYFLSFFILLVYLNDSGAWLFGVIFGKRRNIFIVSPSKSLEGFLGGMIASLIVSFAFIVILPEYVVGISPGSPLLAVLMALTCGFTTIVGDLSESALKRFTNVKDSGDMIMGRGGLLDSIDSLLLTAPVFYYFIAYFLGISF
jgi:phosphatidate cytidylyltransferase